MTDMSSLGNSLSFLTANGAMVDSELQSDADTVMMDDQSVDISSPPRTGKGQNIPNSVVNPMFPYGNNLPYRHAPASPTLYNATSTPAPKGHEAHKSRRLVNPDLTGRRLNMDDSSDHSLKDMLQDYSPYHLYRNQQKRLTLKALDLNERSSSKRGDDESLETASTRGYQTTYRRLSRDSSSTGQCTAPTLNRKRSSLERRNQESPRTPYRRTPSRGNNLFSEPSSSGSSMITCSPHLSPNSFITMDGRYVQSRNPFSSPMVQDEAESTPRSAADADSRYYQRQSAAPPFPVAFSSDEEEKYDHQYLPPRRQGRQATLPPSFQGMNGGFPDHRFSFTGSPIAETLNDFDYSPIRAPKKSHTFYDDAMETDTASSGSLHKVRRLSRDDDVVAATGQHLRLASISYRSLVRRPPSIDTSLESDDESRSGKSMPWEGFDGVSPTDVQSFPHVPPTPIKQKRGPPQPPYARPRNSDAHETEQSSKSRFHGDFDIISELGKGSFGRVYKVLSRLDGCMYAIKAAHRQAKGRADRDRMLKEVYALATLSDQADTATFHIVRYHQAWMEDNRLYIQTELCTGTLMDEINRSGGLKETRKYKLLREILLALAFIHRNNMVHLDIKPENIFLKNDQFKLGDFGLVSMASASQEVEEGDSRYMSMELLSGDRSDLTKSDIFSLGISMYEMSLGKSLPMNGSHWQDLRSGRFDPLQNTSPELELVIKRMMDPNPTNRPSAVELLKHPQLLSEEQKALIRERDKVAQANLQLQAAQQLQKFPPPTLPFRKKLTRANTWNGTLPNC